MITFNEARQRAAVYNGSIARVGIYGEFCCTLNEWTAKERSKRAVYTDDLEDAYLSIASLRRQDNALRASAVAGRQRVH